MGTVKLTAWSGEGNFYTYCAIPSGDVLSIILDPVVINLLYWI